MLRSRALSGFVGVGMSLGAIVVACGSSSSSSGFGDGSSGGSSSGASGSSGSSGLFGDGGSSGGILGDAACAANTSRGQQQPLDMYIMLDQSLSMAQSSKWPSVAGALTTFFDLPAAAGLGVGIQYFAQPQGGTGCPATCTTNADCNGQGTCIPFLNKCTGCLGGGAPDSCIAADYAKPEIAIATLPGAAPALKASVGAHGPSTGTPTSAALQGAVDHAHDWATAHAGHVTIVVFATDGEPEECDTSLPNIDAIAAAAAAANPKILTFVIGVGGSLSNLDGIAAAGGTGKAFLVDTNANVTAQFLDALNKIRGTALGCQYSLPPATGGGSLDYGTVNVQFFPSGGGKPVVFPKVEDKTKCPATGDAWYYDNNAKPTSIILCDTSCKVIAADSGGEIKIVVGCATVVK